MDTLNSPCLVRNILLHRFKDALISIFVYNGKITNNNNFKDNVYLLRNSEAIIARMCSFLQL